MMIKNFILSLVMAILVFGLIHPKSIDFIQKLITFGQANPITVTYVIIAVIIFVITFIMLSMTGRTGSSKEDFFFQVSRHLPRCRNGFIGRPSSYEYSTYDDRTETCQTINDIEKDIYFGWDGLQNVRPSNIVGGCDYSQWSGMGRI